MVRPAYWGVPLLGVSIAMLVLDWVCVVLRMAARRRMRAFGLDDWLMCAGLIIFTVFVGLMIEICFLGAGYPSKELTDDELYRGIKYYYPAELIYVASSVPIRCSICVALIRISGIWRGCVWTLHAIMSLTVVNFVVFTVALLNVCKPISAMWDHGAGTCNQHLNVAVSYFFSAVAILTDWTIAVLPIFLVWNIKMKLCKRILVVCILALAALASCATIVRIQVLYLYNVENEYMLAIGRIALWSTVEGGIGIWAGSMPFLRPILPKNPFRRTESHEEPKLPPLTRWGSKTVNRHPDPMTLGSVPTVTTPEPTWDPTHIRKSQDNDSWLRILRETRFSVHSEVSLGYPRREKPRRSSVLPFY